METPWTLDFLPGGDLLPSLDDIDLLGHSHAEITNPPSHDYELFVSSMFQTTDHVILPSRRRSEPRPAKDRPAKEKRQTSRVRKVYPDKQKQQLAELQQQYDSMQQKLQALTIENFKLKCRSNVLHDMVACLDDLEAVYSKSDRKPSKRNADQIVQELADKNHQIQDLTLKIIQAEDGSEEALRAVEASVMTMNHNKLESIWDPSDISLLLALHLHQALPLLKVPEEQHWRNVIQSLRLTPEQQASAAVALELVTPANGQVHQPPQVPPSLLPPPITSSSGQLRHAPHPYAPPSLLPPPAASSTSSGSDLSYPPSLASSEPMLPLQHMELFETVHLPDSSSSCQPSPQHSSALTSPPPSLPLSQPFTHQQQQATQLQHTEAPLASSSAPLTSTGPAFSNVASWPSVFPLPTPPASSSLPAPPSPTAYRSYTNSLPSCPGSEDLDRLDRHISKFCHKAQLLNHYMHSKLLTRMQSARAHVTSYPFFANPFAILHAIANKPEESEHSKGSQ